MNFLKPGFHHHHKSYESNMACLMILEMSVNLPYFVLNIL